nr:retrovirus-related Pol polyprotein from transposon TNT 1-94 [Tanacetum cinerariifolium]
MYVGQPPGFVSNQYPDHVYALDKALYGLKQAPQAWYDILSQFLIESDFQKECIKSTIRLKLLSCVFKKSKDALLFQRLCVACHIWYVEDVQAMA